MKKFNSVEEIEKYYNKNTNTYEFVKYDIRLDVEFAFDLKINGHIKAKDINALDIDVYGIDAYDIKAQNINAYDIKAQNINAGDIIYFTVCYAYRNIECSSIKGIRANAKHFVLDGEIKIIEKEKEKEK